MTETPVRDPLSSFKFAPKPATAIAMILLLVAANILFFGRTIPWLRLAPVTKRVPDFYSHISNFALTFEMTLLVAVLWVLLGVKLNVLLMLFATAAVVNVLTESFVTVLNTPDMMDAMYGTVAVLMAALVTLIIRRHGVTERTSDRGAVS